MEPKTIRIDFVCTEDGERAVREPRYDGTCMQCPRCGHYPMAHVTTPLEIAESKAAA